MYDWTMLEMLPAAGEGRISYIELHHVHTRTAVGPLPLLSKLTCNCKVDGEMEESA